MACGLNIQGVVPNGLHSSKEGSNDCASEELVLQAFKIIFDGS